MATPPKDPSKLQQDLINEQKKTTQTLEKLRGTVDGEALETLKEQLAEEKRHDAANEKAAKERQAELKKQTKIAQEQKAQAQSMTEVQLGAFKAEDAYRKVEKEIYDAERELQQLLYEASQSGDANSVEMFKQNLHQLAVQKNYFNRQNRDNIEASKRRFEAINAINEGVKQRADSVKERRERYKTEKEDAQKRTEQIVEDFVSFPGGLRDITDQIKLQTETAELSIPMLEKQFKEATFLRMDMAGDKGIAGLYDVFTEAQLQFQEGNIGQEELNKIMKEVSDGINDREKQREAERAAELQNMALTQIGQSINKVGSSLGDFAGKAVKTGGLLAGLAGLVLGVIDPELLMKIITDLTTGFLDLVEGFMAFFTGDFDTFQTKVKENLGLFSTIIGGILLYFAGPLLTAFGGIFTNLAKLVRAVRVFRGFMLVTFIPTMIAGLTSIGMSMGFAAGTLGVVLAPVLAIIAVIGLLYAGFKALSANLGPGASIVDSMKVAALHLVDFLSMLSNGLTFIPRKIIGFLGPKIAKFLFGDDFDTTKFETISKGLDTGRGARAAEEIRLKNEKKAAEEAMKEKQRKIEGTVDFDDPMAGIEIEGLQSQQFDLKMAQTGKGGTTIVGGTSAVNSSTNNNNITSIQYAPPSASSQMIEATAGR